MLILVKSITDDGGFQLIQRRNYEWKIGPKAFLDYGTRTPQLGGGHMGWQSIDLGWQMPPCTPVETLLLMINVRGRVDRKGEILCLLSLFGNPLHHIIARVSSHTVDDK